MVAIVASGKRRRIHYGWVLPHGINGKGTTYSTSSTMNTKPWTALIQGFPRGNVGLPSVSSAWKPARQPYSFGTPSLPQLRMDVPHRALTRFPYERELVITSHHIPYACGGCSWAVLLCLRIVWDTCWAVGFAGCECFAHSEQCEKC